MSNKRLTTMLRVGGFGLAAALATGLTLGSPALAKVNDKFYGTVVHVSTNNIKVHDPQNGQTMSFLLTPSFKNIWSDDGKTTYQMSFLHPGTPVEIIYDQTAFGARHADKIIVLRNLGRYR